MNLVLTALLGVVAIVLAIPVAVLALQAVVAFARDPGRAPPQGRRPRMAVLVPAHDESSGLIPTVRTVLAQLVPGDRCVVVADNCTDDTASIAAAAGAEIVERFDSDRRGKGYALDHGIRHLDADPPEVLVVVDADCLVGAGCLDRIGRLSLATQRPVQALYLMTAPERAGRMKAIAEFAWRVKNWGRALGYLRLGLPCQLMGTGMAFPWRRLRSIDLASGHLVEDMKMGIDLARIGAAPLFCPDVRVTSTFPTSDAGAKSQRTRWEHGHLAMIVHEVPALLVDAVRRRSAPLAMMTLDLAVPPLALLVMTVGIALAITAVVAATTPVVAPLIAMGVVAALLTTAVLLFWIRFGTDVVSMATLGLAAFYALRKIPVYAKFVIGRQMDWVRSRRDVD